MLVGIRGSSGETSGIYEHATRSRTNDITYYTREPGATDLVVGSAWPGQNVHMCAFTHVHTHTDCEDMRGRGERHGVRAHALSATHITAASGERVWQASSVDCEIDVACEHTQGTGCSTGSGRAHVYVMRGLGTVRNRSCVCSSGSDPNPTMRARAPRHWSSAALLPVLPARERADLSAHARVHTRTL